MKLSRIVTLGLALAPASMAIVAIGYGCGSGERPAVSDMGWGPGSNGGGNGLLTGPCENEGQSVACHVETGREGNVVNCFSGTQTCTNGVWGPCGGSTGTMSTLISTASLGSSGDLSILAVTSSDASASASGCASNPCNPWCLGIDTDAGGLQPGSFTTTASVQGALIDYSAFPTAKQGAMSVTANWCPMTTPAPTAGTYGYRECNYDYCCATPDGGGSTGTCVKWVDQPDAGTCVNQNATTSGYTVPVGAGSKLPQPVSCNTPTSACNGVKDTNAAWSTQVGDITDSDTSVTVASAATFAYDITKGSFYIKVDSEYMRVTAVVGNTFTVVRAQGGTTAAAHTDGAYIGLAGIADLTNPVTNCDLCSYDTHCVAGTCQPNSPSGTSSGLTLGCGTASGADLVMAPPCVDQQGYWHFPVCNRGNVDVTTSSLHLGLYDTTVAGRMDGYPGCASNPSPATPDKKVWSTSLSTAGPKVPAGGCLDVTDLPGAANFDSAQTTIETTSPATTLMAKKWGVMVNSDKNTTECNYCNNWQVFDPAVSKCLPPSQPDFTVGVGCTDSSGTIHIPVCNRGYVDATSGNLVLIDWTANPNAAGTSTICQLPTSGSYKGKCTVNLGTSPIAKGKCVDINLSSPPTGITCDPGLFGAGNHTSMVNPPSGTYGTAYTQLSEADRCNNQSFVYTQTGSCQAYGVQPPPPAASTYTYTAICPPGYSSQWNQFSYSTSVPTQSDVLFQATTQPLSADGGGGTATASVNLANPGLVGSPDPANCPMSGPSPCPKNLATLLGANAKNPILNIKLTLNSTSAVPTVNSWSVTYNCRPTE